jgi:hypothetical protein
MTTYEANLTTAETRIARAPKLSQLDVALSNWEYLFQAGRWSEAKRLWAKVEQLRAK